MPIFFVLNPHISSSKYSVSWSKYSVSWSKYSVSWSKYSKYTMRTAAQARVKYPEYFGTLTDDGRSWFYFISKEPGYYKFGITTTLLTRMRTHYRDFQFEHIDAVIDCGCDAIMQSVETEFKREAAKRQILLTRYDKTEVIAAADIKPYIHWVHLRVAELSKLPQPPNNRSEARKEKKYKAELDVMIKLREHDVAEIALLREKIKTLEELLLLRE